MKTKYGFTQFTVTEFEHWLSQQSIARTIRIIQQHHTWLPSYAQFEGYNHFKMQKGMRDYHVGHNGWSDIGQQLSIFPDGTVMTGRSFNRTPACIGGANSYAVCIENIGNFDKNKDQMNPEQADAIIRVTAALLTKIGISTPSKHNIVYHHWYDSNGRKRYGKNAVKSCPGTAFFGGNKLDDFESNFLPLVTQALGGGVNIPSYTGDWVAVTASSLNIRTGASSSKPKVKNLHPAGYDAILRVYQRKNGWLKISSRKQHWVYGRYTHQVRSAVVNTDDSKIRFGPGTNHTPPISSLDIGDEVFVHETSNSWARVGPDRWIHKSLLNYAQ